MTLTEARKILEYYQPTESEITEALKTVLAILPSEPRKPGAEERLAEIINTIGHDPFNGRKYRKYAVWRQCIIYQMYLEGYINAEITRATGQNHATVTHAVQCVRDGLQYKDELTHKTWKKLLELLH